MIKHTSGYMMTEQEARWATFLDYLSISWEFRSKRYEGEPEKMPSFWLPYQDLWLAIEPEADKLEAMYNYLDVSIFVIRGAMSQDYVDIGDYAGKDSKGVPWVEKGYYWAECTDCHHFTITDSKEWCQLCEDVIMVPNSTTIHEAYEVASNTEFAVKWQSA